MPARGPLTSLQARHYLEVLHLPPSATLDQVKQAYKDLVRVWHPDRFGSDPRLQKVAESKLMEINVAHDSLVSSWDDQVREAPGQKRARLPGRKRPRIPAQSPRTAQFTTSTGLPARPIRGLGSASCTPALCALAWLYSPPLATWSIPR